MNFYEKLRGRFGALAELAVKPAQFVRWADRLLEVARSVSAGHYDVRLGDTELPGRFGELTRTFDGMLDEITRREHEIREREDWFRSVLQHSSDLVTITDGDGQFRYVSPAVERVLGATPEALLGTKLTDWVHPSEAERLGEVIKYLASQPNRVAAAEHRFRHADGHEIFIESIAVNLLGNTAVKGIVINSRDVTRRRRIEEMLRLVTSAVDQGSDGVVITSASFDPPGPQIVYVNPAILRQTGFDEHELVGSTTATFEGPGAAELILQRMQDCLATGRDTRFEVVNKSKDGRQYPALMHITPLKGETGIVSHFVCLSRDITEERKAEADRERLEATLRQALKMEAVGTLAGGIAHDFNNVLLPMMMLTQLTINRLAPDSRERQDLTRVLAAQKRAKSLVGQILAFSRGSSGEYGPVDLRAICRETLTLLRASLPATVTLIELLDDTPKVYADSTQVQQVLMNLCSNAAQAMPSGKGTIRICLDTVALSEADAPSGLREGLYCRLAVIDDGSGIPPAILERIFDPFFTTKEVGVGTGLGLSVVHGIVTAHHGAITVESKPGQGTRFVVFLPIEHVSAAADELTSVE